MVDTDRLESPGVRFPPPVVYLIAVALAWCANRFAPWSFPVQAGVGVRWAFGAALLALGMAFDVAAALRFRRAGTTLLPFRGATQFVVAGPYRFTRNPMYLGMTLITVALAFLLDNLWQLPAAFAAATVLDRWIIPREERHLEARFGESYQAYKGRVRRWLGVRG